MKKKITLTLLALVCALCCALGLAACGDKGDVTDAAQYITYRLQDDDTYAVSFSDDTGKMFNDYVVNGEKPMHCFIPAEHNGKPVTAIDDFMFLGRVYITSITIPDSIKTIGKQAFDDCGITSIDLPDGLTSIGNYAFANTKLASINLPNSVTSIGEGAFSNCSQLASINLPNSVTYLGEYVFGDGEYSTCAIKNLALPNSLTEIGLGALCGCKELESLTLKFPEDKKIIAENGEESSQRFTLGHIFGGDSTSLKTLTVKGGCVSGFNGGGFTALKNVILYDGVYLVTDVFNECPSLEYNEYENGLYLGSDTNKYRFLIKAKNTDITSLAIHESTQAICSSAFRDCDKLTTVRVSNFEFKKANSKTEKISLKELFNLDKETATVKTIIVSGGVTYLPENTFYFALTELVLPISLTEIDSDAIFSEIITNIRYVGTKAQLRQVEFGWGWCGGISAENSGATIHCSDGDIFVSWYGHVSGT